MTLHENRLPADKKYRVIFKKWQNLQLSSAANYRWPFKG